MEALNKRAEKTILGKKCIFIMSNSKFKSSNKYQNPNPKENVFDIEAFEFDLTFSLNLHFWKFNMNIIPCLKWDILEGIV